MAAAPSHPYERQTQNVQSESKIKYLLQAVLYTNLLQYICKLRLLLSHAFKIYKLSCTVVQNIMCSVIISKVPMLRLHLEL